MSSKKSGTDFSLSVSFHATDRLKSVPLLLIALARQDRVEEERESRQALGAVLRAKSEEDDAALADIRLDHRRATADEFVAENPSAQQWALRFGITRDRAGARRVSDLEGRAVFKPRDRFFLQPEGERAWRIQLRAEYRPRAVEIARRNAFEDVARGGAKFLDREIGGVVERDHRATGLDKFAQRFDARFAQPPGVFRRVDAGNPLFSSGRFARSARGAWQAVDQRVDGLIGNDDRVVFGLQTAGADFGVEQRGVGNLY